MRKKGKKVEVKYLTTSVSTGTSSVGNVDNVGVTFLVQISPPIRVPWFGNLSSQVQVHQFDQTRCCIDQLTITCNGLQKCHRVAKWAIASQQMHFG